jgi:hypothetical protein
MVKETIARGEFEKSERVYSLRNTGIRQRRAGQGFAREGDLTAAVPWCEIQKLLNKGRAIGLSDFLSNITRLAKLACQTGLKAVAAHCWAALLRVSHVVPLALAEVVEWLIINEGLVNLVFDHDAAGHLDVHFFAAFFAKAEGHAHQGEVVGTVLSGAFLDRKQCGRVARIGREKPFDKRAVVRVQGQNDFRHEFPLGLGQVQKRSWPP